MALVTSEDPASAVTVPEHRRAIAGRTHAQTWEPRAVEVYRSPSHAVYDLAIAFLLVLFCVLVALGVA
jgi:hypothetical protein